MYQKYTKTCTKNIPNISKRYSRYIQDIQDIKKYQTAAGPAQARPGTARSRAWAGPGAAWYFQICVYLGISQVLLVYFWYKHEKIIDAACCAQTENCYMVYYKMVRNRMAHVSDPDGILSAVARLAVDKVLQQSPHEIGIM